MFNIDEKPVFNVIAEVHVPGAETENFGVTFGVLKISEIENIDLRDGASVARLLERVIINFDDVVDEKGAPVPFSSDLVTRVIDLPHARQALMRAYFSGLNEAAAGN